MGIRNREGALYIATGVDNTGLYAGRREAMGIIKAMASQITSFDVFSGIGISAATAFASAAKSAYNFEKEFHKNMLEVATISTQVSGNMADFMNRVLAITQQIPVTAPEAAKALYQIVSAGHDGAAGMQILEVAAKSAVGGLTDTATAADAITTILNAYKLSADQAATVSDQLFTTVRLGKTDFGQLGQSIAQVAPIAASYGVEIDQVLAAVASLTKSGTPTSQAMIQVRSAILSTAKVLGDGAFEGRTFQEALAEVAARANGSESKLRQLVPEIEAMNGVLGLTGINAKSTASDLTELQKSAGATEAAFQKMRGEIGNQMKMLSSNIHAILRPMGEAILKNVSEATRIINEGFESGKIEGSLETLKKLLVGVSGAFLTYKAAMNMSSNQQAAESAITTVLNNLKILQNKITGEAIIAKEKERVYQEAYNASLEKTITQEERATLAKLNLKTGSVEYSKTLSELALQEKKNAESLVDSLTKQITKNKEKLVVAQENLNASREAVEAAKKEFDAAFEANDLAGVEAAQTKLNAAAKREEAEANKVATTSQKLNRQQKQLTVATTQAEIATTRLNTATTKADAEVKDIDTRATNKLKLASSGLWGVMKANPIGAVLTLVSLATTAYMMWGTKIDSVSSKMKRFNLTSKSSLDATQKAIDGNADSLESLVGKYNELKKISSPTHKEQKTLRDIVKSIAEIVPSATTAIDQYNNALDINADKAVEYVKKQKEILTDLSGKNVTEWMNELRTSSKEIAIAKEELTRGIKYSTMWGFNEANQLSPSETEVTKRQIKELEIKRDLIFELLSKTGIAEKELRVELAKLFDPKAWFNSAFEFEGGQDALKRFDEYFAKKNFIEEQKERKEAKKRDSETTEEEKPLTILQRKLTLTKELAAAEANLKKLRASDSMATDAEIAEAEKERDEIKKKLQALTGLSEKESDKRKQFHQELSRSILDSELKLQADRIAIMKDGKDKRILLADQEYKETLSAIEKARAEYQKKVKEAGRTEDPAVMATFDSRESAARSKRDTDVAGINKEYFDDYTKRTKALTDVFLSEEKKRLSAVKERYDEEREWANEQLKTGGMSEDQYQSYVINIDKAEAEESLRSLLDKYQDYAQQKEELERQYTDEIATLTQKRTDANKAEVDAAIAQARKRHKEEAASLDFEAFKKSIDFSEVFGNLNRLSDQALSELIQKMKEFRSEAATSLQTDELKEYMDALEKLRDESFDRKNGWAEAFGLIPDVIKERIKLEEEYAAAEELALNAAEKKRAAEEELQNSTSKFNSLIKKLTGAQGDLTDANEEYVLSLIKRKGLEQGLSEEQIEANIQTYKESAANVQQLAQGVADAGEESNKASSMFAKAGEALKSFKGNAGSTVAIIDAIIKGVHQGIQAMSQISDSFMGMYEALGKDTSIDTAIGKFGEFMNLLSEFDNYAYSAWENLKSGNIAGAVADTISSITSVIKNIAAWGDKKKERKIGRLQEQVEELDKSYEKLSDSIEKAYSVDASELIEQQNQMLEQQKVLIQQQISEEEKKKNSDNDRIKEWKNQLEDIDKTLADNEEKAKDAIFGEDLKSAIDNFANAYAEAWAAGEDRAASMKDVARNMIKQTVIELIKSSAGLGETVKKIREMILGYLSDGVVDEWEQRELDSYIESETARLDAKYGWADKYMKEDKGIDLGISGDSLADTIVEGLRAGKAGIKDFSGSFEEMMKTAVLNSLKTKYLEGPLKEFQKKFAALSESGGQLTEAEIEELRAMYSEIIDGAKVQFDSLKEISGLDFLDDSDNTLKGAFAKASQESIDLLAGQAGAQRAAIEAIREMFRFIYELQKQGWQDVRIIRDLTTKVDKNTALVAENTREIRAIAQNISENTKQTVETLDSIDNRGIKVKM